MRKMKYVIGVLLLFMLIGYATISVSLSLGGKANVLSDLDDFKVYFSNVLVNGEQDLSLVKSDKELEFEFDLKEIGSTYTITYDVTNASSVFDASLSINCTNGDDILSVVNEFDTSTLAAKTTRTGNLTLKKLKPNLNTTTTTYSVSCSIKASAISRDSNASGDIPGPIQHVSIDVGDVISIAGENFNVISQTEDTVTMLAQYNLGTNYRQSETENLVSFSNSNGWSTTNPPTDLDIQQFSGNAKTYVNEYVSYLKSVTDDESLTGNLITLKELKSLGCDITDKYDVISDSPPNCKSSENLMWLQNNQKWWTRSVFFSSNEYIWFYSSNIFDYGYDYGYSYASAGIRPTITISRDLAKKYLFKDYNVGDFVILGNEKFNVISDNGSTVTLFAQKNLGTDYRQNDSYIHLEFSNSKGWLGKDDIDIQSYDGNVKTYVNQYSSYLKSLVNDEYLKVDLISLSQLKKLGCSLISDPDLYGKCDSSPHSAWLINGNDWWTKTAISSEDFYVVNNSDIDNQYFRDDAAESFGKYGVRPVVTISKDYINMKKIIFVISSDSDYIYYANEGMTIKDWVNSSYNTDGYYYAAGYLYEPSGVRKVSINSGTLITEDLNIILTQGNTSGGHSGGSG